MGCLAASFLGPLIREGKLTTLEEPSGVCWIQLVLGYHFWTWGGQSATQTHRSDGVLSGEVCEKGGTRDERAVWGLGGTRAGCSWSLRFET